MTKTEKSKIIAETHKLLDRAEQIFDEMITVIKAHKAALPRGNGKTPEGDA